MDPAWPCFHPVSYTHLDVYKRQDQSIISYVRRGLDNSFVIIVLNFTPVLREGYRIGVPQAGTYNEVFNSDAACYGGSNQGNGAGLHTEDVAWMNRSQSLVITLPPLAGLVLKPA